MKYVPFPYLCHTATLLLKRGTMKTSLSALDSVEYIATMRSICTYIIKLSRKIAYPWEPKRSDGRWEDFPKAISPPYAKTVNRAAEVMEAPNPPRHDSNTPVPTPA